MMILLLFATLFVAFALLLHGLTADRAKAAKLTLSRLEEISRAPQSPQVEGEDLMVRRGPAPGATPWLDRLLGNVQNSARLRLLLYQSGLSWTAGRLLSFSLLGGALAGGLIYARTRAAMPSLVCAALAAAAPFFWMMHKRGARMDRIRQQLPEALDLMVASLRAGHALASSIGMAAKESPEPLRRELRQCFDEQNYGIEMRSAMQNLAYRVPVHDVRIIATAVAIQKDSGGNLTEVLEKSAHIIREGFRLQRQISIHTAQGRLTGWILSIFPVALGFLLYLVNPEYMSLLWRNPLGVKLMWTSAGMTLAGALIIRRIVRFQV
jgi:tight adherence protein B